MGKRMLRVGNRIGVWLYKTSDGRVGSGSKDVLVLMLTTPGRRTGVPRSTCVRYLETADGLLVWGTGSGSRHDPDWFCNLRAADSTDVQIGAEHTQMRMRELTGAERGTIWTDVILREDPGIGRFATKARRTIPVAVLEPLEG
ncbi:deazaflavin-dependent oxidoreductase (nitroreductase family) [Kribbella rubisoli]|jgi:deazaflavin-dependent oxidoreductase (nitroreductase family)|uniref:Deazaflavin-dependent oxidoreductase (Nitroreductase family) n=1 Tax=Kribbella rubisoli TaxID=3075929 RepID=A0A4Q7X763_9ACTN|nr:nitroreductase/quinone reductase family protein [Kribbella rubisoli]RZU18874.1 deazaflavin-dependent oxidoreductase (nitroreductase family) [Kribbella rubisoli]